jgi:hypothetical protein
MKFATDRPYANPETAARKLVEIANAVEPVQEGTPAEYKAGLDRNCSRLESGTYVKFTQVGAELFA